MSDAKMVMIVLGAWCRLYMALRVAASLAIEYKSVLIAPSWTAVVY